MAAPTITFERCDNWDDLKPGQWTPTKTSAGPSAVISCPRCGMHGELDHTVAADGAVDPSLVCPAQGCGFHEWGRLAGWRP